MLQQVPLENSRPLEFSDVQPVTAIACEKMSHDRSPPPYPSQSTGGLVLDDWYEIFNSKPKADFLQIQFTQFHFIANYPKYA